MAHEHDSYSHSHGHGHGHSHSHSTKEEIERLEAEHFYHIVNTFKQYESYSLSANNRRRKDFYRIPLEHQQLLEETVGWKKRLEEVDRLIALNAEVLRDIVSDVGVYGMGEGYTGENKHPWTQEEESPSQSPNGTSSDRQSLFHSAPHPHAGQWHDNPHTDHPPPPRPPPHPYENLHHSQKKRKEKKVTDFDMDKLRSTLKQFSRDWSEEGVPEREACYKPMLDALLDHFSDVPEQDRVNIRVLVPGAGLARLAWEAARLGFACQGNEFSHFMLLSSYFILNRTERINQHTIYPYIHSFSNVPTSSSLFRAISVPDVLPSDLPENSDFSLVAGDFVEVYGVTDEDEEKEKSGDVEGGFGKESQEGKWNAALTCFFIDTAKDILEYLRIIHRILAPGGVWINLGPLLWHFENNNTGDPSIELTLDDVKLLSKKIGFEIHNEKTIPTTYTSDVKGMLRHEYQCAFWVGKKI